MLAGCDGRARGADAGRELRNPRLGVAGSLRSCENVVASGNAGDLAVRIEREFDGVALETLVLILNGSVSYTHLDVYKRQALAKKREWDHLTLLAGIEMHGVWEITAISYFGLVFVAGNGIWHINRPNSRAYNGVGAFQLVRREAYERAGGHQRLALEVIDDMKLGKIIKLAGFRSGTGVAFDEVRVRWQAGLRNIIAGVTKRCV